MNSDAALYIFKIYDFTPETMPFGRLLEYYSEITKMLNVGDNMHLINVIESSHGSQFAIDINYEGSLSDRLNEINDKTAPPIALRAHDKINALLKEDKTSGRFSDPSGENVIDFPGKRADASIQISIRDAATFTGELYYIAGTANDAKIRIKTDKYGVVYCSTTKAIAKNLRDFLFEDVRVSGRGLWKKTQNGTWAIDDFTITDFSPVERENLREAINRLRAIGVQWPDDPLGKIRALEEKDGTIQ